MLSLCKTVHTLLGFAEDDDPRRRRRRRSIAPLDAGGLRLLAGDHPKPPSNVVESSAIGKPPAQERAIDPGARGLQDAGGGLGLCTESLGAESSDGGMGIDEEASVEIGEEAEEDRLPEEGGRWRRPPRWRRAAKEFPPPLPWLRDGRRRCFLRSVRQDGRLLVTEVRIERPPEILRASRRDGRLRLELVGPSDPDDDEKEISHQEQLEEEEIEEVEEEEEEEREELEVAGEERREVGWWAKKSDGARCHGPVSGNSSIPPWWTHRFVTTA